jgi:hypothetical protein
MAAGMKTKKAAKTTNRKVRWISRMLKGEIRLAILTSDFS